MMLKIILWASIGWMPILICVMLINEAKFKKNIAVGVTLPYEAREDAEIQKILAKYRKNMIIVNAIMLVLACACMFFNDEMSVMTSWFIWLDAAIVAPYIPYISTNTKLREIKAQRGWIHPEEQHTLSVNMDAIPSSTWISPWVFAPSGIICLLLIAFDQEMAVMYIMFAAFCASFWIGYRYLYRNKAEMVDEDTDLTIALSRIRKYNWGKMWIICSYAMTAYAVSMCFLQQMPVLSMALILIITVVLCFYAFKIEFKTRHLQEKLTKDSGHEWYADEDDHWIWGLFYYNKDDSRLIINNRIGVNSTINLAKTSGKIFMALTVLLLAAMPFTGIWIGSIGSQDILMSSDTQEFTVQSGSTVYRIELSDIKEVTLLEELPEHLSRKMGTGMEHYLEGKFSASQIGNVTVLLDPTVPPFILIQTNEGKYYLFGSRDESTTRDACAKLQSTAAVTDDEVSLMIQFSPCCAC